MIGRVQKLTSSMLCVLGTMAHDQSEAVLRAVWWGALLCRPTAPKRNLVMGAGAGMESLKDARAIDALEGTCDFS